MPALLKRPGCRRDAQRLSSASLAEERAVVRSSDTRALLLRTPRAPAVRMTTQSCCRNSPSKSLCFRPVRSAATRAISRKVRRASGAQAPEGSATIGMNSTPCRAHSSAVLRKFRLKSSYISAAVGPPCTTRVRASSRCGDVIAKSSAAGMPPFHLGR